MFLKTTPKVIFMPVPSYIVSLLLLLGVTITSCTVGPEYKTPQVTAPHQWNGENLATKTQAASVARWWTVFNDPILEDLINQSAEHNTDLKIAYARLQEYRALQAIATGQKMPEIGVGFNASRQGVSENGFIGAGATYSDFQLDGRLSWEVDLFGRIKRTIQAAEADYQAEEENYTDVLTSLYANVAYAYLELRTLQTRQAILEENLEAQQQSLDLAKARFKHGLADQLEVTQAERLYASARAEIPALRALQSQSLNQLAVLLGKTPEQMPRPELAALPTPPAHVVSAVPVDLLRQRPDIRRSERQLAAQTARLGIAHANLYPNLSISALIGLQALDSSDLLDSGSGIWSFGISSLQKLFNGGRLRNMIKVEDARTNQALYTYEKTVIQALSEVETAMAFYVEQKKQLNLLGQALTAAQSTVKAANSLYKEGLVDFQNVLDANRRQLEIEDRLVQTKGDHAAGLVRLYQALGGGWDPENHEIIAPNTSPVIVGDTE